MADTAAADPAPAATPKAKKARGTSKKGAAAKPTHPPYKNMIVAAIKSLKERKGSSRQAILKYIIANYKVGDEKKAAIRLKHALRKATEDKTIKQNKGTGASGSFSIAGKEAGEKAPVKKAKKPKAKKAAGEKKEAKPRKPKAKKPAAKKAAKPKKPAAKKAAKKPAVKKAKKPAPKKAGAKKAKK